jgi:hypothetical protein
MFRAKIHNNVQILYGKLKLNVGEIKNNKNKKAKPSGEGIADNLLQKLMIVLANLKYNSAITLFFRPSSPEYTGQIIHF